ncbi:MAG: heterodisulfide reductase subunit A, partial [Deltaproteobacteria bacterium]|nr:heterodisulfide reductase subunit A [Deltaproteobacteria bacterium]
MEEYIISLENLRKLAENIIKDGIDIFAPSLDNGRFVKIIRSEELNIFPDKRPSDISAKQSVFPKCDSVLFYKREKSTVELKEIEPKVNQVLFGLKPCDAASFRIMHKVFNWDYKDEFFNKRLENTLIIGLACTFFDEYCFCTSVGLSPVSTVGSDMFLVRISDDTFAALAVTDKGKQLASKYSALFSKGDSSKS